MSAIGKTAEKIANLIRANNEPEAEIILCSDFKHYQENEQALLTSVESGKTLIILKAPVGTHETALGSITVKEAAMHPRFFVSARTDHPIVENFEPKDFYWWFDPDLDRPAPLAESVLLAEGWNTVLSTTDHGWASSDTPDVSVCIERSYGEGTIIVSQLELDRFISHNPPARYFVDALAHTPKPLIAGI